MHLVLGCYVYQQIKETAKRNWDVFTNSSLRVDAKYYGTKHNIM